MITTVAELHFENKKHNLIVKDFNCLNDWDDEINDFVLVEARVDNIIYSADEFFIGYKDEYDNLYLRSGNEFNEKGFLINEEGDQLDIVGLIV